MIMSDLKKSTPSPWKRRKTTSSAISCATGVWGLRQKVLDFIEKFIAQSTANFSLSTSETFKHLYFKLEFLKKFLALKKFVSEDQF